MTGYDNVEASSSRVEVDFIHVMKDVNADSLQLQSEGRRNLRRPRALVVVSPDRVDRRYGAQLVQNLGAADPCANGFLALHSRMMLVSDSNLRQHGHRY